MKAKDEPAKAEAARVGSGSAARLSCVCSPSSCRPFPQTSRGQVLGKAGPRIWSKQYWEGAGRWDPNGKDTQRYPGGA